MIIMDPNDVPSLPILGDTFSKGFVDFVIVDPRVIFVSFALGIVGDLIVENGPKDGLAVVAVVSVKVAVRDIDGQRVVFILKFLGDV